MTRTPHVRLALAIAGAAGASLGASDALAGACSWSIGSYLNGFVPDFDQRRAPGPLFFDGEKWVNIPAGVPGNGVAYCSPTAHTNTMAYLANHGFPGLMPSGSSPSWGSQAEYENVTDAIMEMAGYMQTHPTEGTTCCGSSGLITYIETNAPGKFTVSTTVANQMYAPSLADMAFGAVIGGFVHPMVGWYRNTGPNQWIKAGGHVVTLVGVEGFCGGGPRTMSVRDPGNGNTSLTAQSIFSTQTYNAVATPGFYNTGEDNGGIAVYYQRTHERMMGYDTSDGRRGLLNGYRVVLPKFGVTISPLDRDELMLHYPIRPTHDSGPIVQNLPLATGTPVIDFALDPTLRNIYYTSESPAGGPGNAVYRLDRSTGGSTPIYTGAAPRSVECGRFRQVFILDQTTLVAIDNEIVPPRTTFPSVAPGVACMAYNDHSDELVCLRPSAGQLTLVDGRDPSQPPRTLPLPSGVVFDGEPFMCVSPADGALWIRSKNSPNIYKVVIPRSGAPMLAETASSPLFVGADGLDTHMRQTREHILLARQTGVAEFDKNPTNGQWGPSATSDFAGLAAFKQFRLSRSRDNITPERTLGPQHFDVLPGTFGPSSFDCPGDLDGDGFVGSPDLAALLGSWGPVSESPADMNADGFVNASDLASLLGSWGPCD